MGANPSLDRSGSCGQFQESFKKQAITRGKKCKNLDSFRRRPRTSVLGNQLVASIPVDSFRQNVHRICEDESDFGIPFEADHFSARKILQQDNISETSVRGRLWVVNGCSREKRIQYSRTTAMGSNPSCARSGSYEEIQESFEKQVIKTKKMPEKSDSSRHQARTSMLGNQLVASLPVNSFRKNVESICQDEIVVGIPFEKDYFREIIQQDNILERRETPVKKTDNPVVDVCPLEDILRADAKSFPVEKIILQDNMSGVRKTSVEKTKNSVVDICPLENVLRADAKSFPVDRIILEDNMPEVRETSVEETKNSVVDICPLEDVLRADAKSFPVIILQDNMSEVRETSVEETKNPVVDVCPFEDVLYRFYTDKILTDIILQTNSDLFPAHKLVLCCRSAVFSTMFTEDLNEETRTCVDIAEDADTLRRLLLYIYTNEVQGMQWESAADLFKAAEKYELFDLKEKCSVILKSKISRDNFCGVLAFADMYHETELLDAVLDFISLIPDIFYSEAWKLFKRENPELALNTTERIINNFRIPI